MKKIILSFFAVLTIVACGGSSSDNEEFPYVGKTFQQTVTLPASQVDTVVTLSDLNAVINEIDVGEAWLTVTKLAYTSGAPTVRLTATANDGDNARSCTVTVTATSTDKVLLSVTQEKETIQTGIDDLHNIVTDQPASSRASQEVKL